MDEQDIALQSSCPVISVPMFSDLVPLSESGERVLVASNGIFLEVVRKWGRFIYRTGQLDKRKSLPFGAVEESISLKCRCPFVLLQDFTRIARQHSHREMAASIIWNEKSDTFRLVQCESLSADENHIHYKCAKLAEGEHLFIDCHSHGHHPAYFSRQDDLDDSHDVKFAFVAGNCDQPQPSVAMRLCLQGHYKYFKGKKL